MEGSQRPLSERAKSTVLISSVESASIETDNDLRDVWSSLIANELVAGSVHPEMPKILSRLSSVDAHTLAEIASRSDAKFMQLLGVALAESLPILGSVLMSFMDKDPVEFSHHHLENLGLIKMESNLWEITWLGAEFIRSVTDPAYIDVVETKLSSSET